MLIEIADRLIYLRISVSKNCDEIVVFIPQLCGIFGLTMTIPGRVKEIYSGPQK